MPPTGIQTHGGQMRMNSDQSDGVPPMSRFPWCIGVPRRAPNSYHFMAGPAHASERNLLSCKWGSHYLFSFRRSNGSWTLNGKIKWRLYVHWPLRRFTTLTLILLHRPVPCTHAAYVLFLRSFSVIWILLFLSGRKGRRIWCFVSRVSSVSMLPDCVFSNELSDFGNISNFDHKLLEEYSWANQTEEN